MSILGPVVKNLQVITLPRISEGEDITDWLDNRSGSMNELMKLINPASQFTEISTQKNYNLVVYNYQEFISKMQEEQDYIIDPWLPKMGLAMVHAERGLGKTFFCLSLAIHVALGRNFLNWAINSPLNVVC